MCGRCDGRVRCVGVVKVCGTVLEMGVWYGCMEVCGRGGGMWCEGWRNVV